MDDTKGNTHTQLKLGSKHFIQVGTYGVNLEYETCPCGKCNSNGVLAKIFDVGSNVEVEKVYFRLSDDHPQVQVIFSDGEQALMLEDAEGVISFYLTSHEDGSELVANAKAKFVAEQEGKIEAKISEFRQETRDKIMAEHGEEAAQNFDKMVDQILESMKDPSFRGANSRILAAEIEQILSFGDEPMSRVEVGMIGIGPDGAIKGASDLPRELIEHFRNIVSEADAKASGDIDRPRVLAQIATNGHAFYVDLFDSRSVPEEAISLIDKAVDVISDFMKEKAEAEAQAEQDVEVQVDAGQQAEGQSGEDEVEGGVTDQFANAGADEVVHGDGQVTEVKDSVLHDEDQKFLPHGAIPAGGA